MAPKYPRKEMSPAQWRNWLQARVLSEAQRGFYQAQGAMTVDFVGALSKAVDAAGSTATAEVKALAKAMISGKIAPVKIQKAHREIGQKAQKSIMIAYGRRRKHDLPSYRRTARNPRNVRYAGGRLRAALRSPNFFEATPRGLNFINTQLLTKEAKQWRRLNYGAGVPNSSRQFKVYFGDMIAASIGLDPGTQPGRIKVPPGRFVSPGSGGPAGEAQRPGTPGTGIFYPLGELRTKKTFQNMQNGAYAPKAGPRRPSLSTLTIARPQWAKLAATNFLDAGVRSLAENWGPAYTRLYQDHFNETMIRARRRGSGIEQRSYARGLQAAPPKYMQSRVSVQTKRR